MTMDNLEAIRQRAEAIIPGPWRWFGNTASDQVYLGTTDRGRLIVLDPDTRHTESVFHHEWCESYTLEEARENIQHFCGIHEENEATDPGVEMCRCATIRDFLVGEMDYRDPYTHARDLINERTGYAWLSRSVTTHADLRFSAPTNTTEEHFAAAEERRKQHGGRSLTSYRKFVRYEVLGELRDGYFRGQYKTAAEYDEQAGATGAHIPHLYREDFCGIATPEAEFIEHAAEDIPWLLRELDHAHDLLRRAAVSEQVVELEAQLALVRSQLAIVMELSPEARELVHSQNAAIERLRDSEEDASASE